MKANPLPGTIVAPASKVLPHHSPGRELLGKHPPLATRLLDVENRVDDLTQGILVVCPLWSDGDGATTLPESPIARPSNPC
jgi:hypothetical protein